MERAAILALFPEFARLKHPLPYVSDRQNELLLARLARNAMRLSTGCIVWTANCNNDGYARMSLHVSGDSRTYYVHRVVWQLANGRYIPEWREVAHGCDTPPCFNPEHLKLQRMPDNRKASADNTNRKRLRAAIIRRLAAFSDALRLAA